MEYCPTVQPSVTAGANGLLSVMVPFLCRLERHEAIRDYQRSALTKLSLGYLFNTCIIPLEAADP